MMFGISFLRKPAPQPLRAIVATKAENLLAQRKAADVRMEFEIMGVHMTPEQFADAKARGAVRDEEALARVRHRARLRAKRSSRNAGKAVGV